MNDKLNALERKAIASEEKADSYRWDQACEVVKRLKTETEREIASTWINGRTGDPYSQTHVHHVAEIWRRFGTKSNRPPWSQAMDEVVGGARTSRTQRSESQAPTTPETARKLVANIVAKSPPEVQRAIAEELVKAPQLEPSLKRVAEGPKRHSRTPKPPEVKLGEALFQLWEVGHLLLDEVPDDEAKVRMLALAEKHERLAAAIAQLLDTGQMEEEFAKLVAEVGAEV